MSEPTRSGRWFCDPLLVAIVGTTVVLALGIGLLALVWGPEPTAAVPPLLGPVIAGFAALTALSVGIMALFRYREMHDPPYFWVGSGLCGLGVLLIFHVLTWPGLGPEGQAPIAQLPNTSAWFDYLIFRVLAAFLFLASLLRWPKVDEGTRPRWFWWVIAWLAIVLLVSGLSVAFETLIPQIVADGRYLLGLARFPYGPLLLVGGLTLSIMGCRATGDRFLGFVALAQVILLFAGIADLISPTVFSSWFYLGRGLLAAGLLVLLAGMLVGYVRLYRSERERTEELQIERARLRELNDTLEQRVAERTVQLRALAVELSRAEERERQRVARALHDDLQQMLVAARMHLETLERQLEDLALRKVIQWANDVLGKALDASRSLTAELSPPLLYDAGLTPALYWLGRWMEEKHGLVVQVDAEDLGNQTPEGMRGMLFQAARELLLNIVQHAGVDRAELQLHRLSEDEIELIVSDRGVGFDPAQIGRPEGNGFGLFSIRERMELLGNRMSVESAPGQGTRVELRVRLRPVETAATVAAAQAVASRLMASEQVPEEPTIERLVRVLLADDHAIIRQGLARMLGDEPNIELVGQADNGQEAVALTRQTRPDVVLMDVSMPVMDGIEATRQIKAELPDVQVIGLSIHEKDEMEEQMRQAGAVEYITKGGDPSELIEAIRRLAQRPQNGSDAQL